MFSAVSWDVAVRSVMVASVFEAWQCGAVTG
jgi:hypothetical protein